MTVKSTPKEVGTLKALLNANVELKEAHMTIWYSLMEAETYQNVYFITLRCENDSATVFAGNERKTAKCLFDVLVKGKVTPCTAEDVTRDWFQALCEEK